MKSTVLTPILLVFALQFVFAQGELSETQKLERTAKVWGFLKYYHPQVGKGRFNWDDQLIEILPKIKESKDKEGLSQVYMDWIESLGKIEKCKACQNEKLDEGFDKNFDLSWTQDTIFTPDLSIKLKHIENNRIQGKSHYASKSNVGTIKIINEPEYAYFEYPTEEYRLLSLFKYWNIIEYFFPYKYQTDQNWNDALTEMIPKFKNAVDTTEYHLAMLELVAKIDDSHGQFNTKYTNKYIGLKWIPAKYDIFDSGALITGFFNDSLALIYDLRLGDVVTKANGKSVKSIVKDHSRYIPASNHPVKLRNSANTLFNGSTDSLLLTIKRNEMYHEIQVGRYSFGDFNYDFEKGNDIDKWRKIDTKIGYVNMGILELNDVAKMTDDLQDCSAIIFDIRNYPKGTMYKIADFLNSEPKEFVKFTKPNFDYPGKFKWTRTLSCGTKNKDYYKGKVIILVNEKTQSHAEFTCMALQTAPNATIIGSQTSGADGNVTNFQFVGGYKTRITGLGVFYPDGTETQRIGIVPDIEIKPTIEGLRQGKDEVLEKAIEIAKQ